MNRKETCMPAFHHFTASPLCSDKSLSIFCRFTIVSAKRFIAASISVASPFSSSVTTYGSLLSSACFGSIMVISLSKSSLPQSSACKSRLMIPVVLPLRVFPAVSMLPLVVRSIDVSFCTISFVHSFGFISFTSSKVRLLSTVTSSILNVTSLNAISVFVCTTA